MMKRIPFSNLRSNVLKLPTLPTPQLAHTFAQYGNSVRPVKKGPVADTHFERLAKFTAGSAGELQAILAVRGGGDGNDISWGAWRDDEILRQRLPLPIHSNVAVGFKKFGAVDASAFDSHVILKKVSQCQLAAQIINSLTKFVRSACADGVAVADELCDVSNIPDQLCSARVPHLGRDSISRGDWAQDGTHVVILRDGHIYMLRVVCETTGRLVDTESLFAAINHILITTPLVDHSCPVSALTALPREEACTAFKHLCQESPSNAASIAAIEKAIAVVCLDTEAWPTPEVKQQFMLFGSGAESESRWYHKNQIIISADAEVAVNFERSLSDNHASRVWCNALFNDVQYALLAGLREQDSFAPLPAAESVAAPATSLVKPVEFIFGKSFSANIRSAKESARKLADGVSVDYVRIPTISLGIHPEAFMQTCFQLAYYIEHRRAAPTTEEISLQSFFNGGMAYVRTGMPIVKPFLELWRDWDKDSSAVTIEALRTALKAIELHYIAKLAEVGQGRGVGEHLHALEYVACVKESRNPRFADAREFFNDPIFKAWDTPLLATGSVSAPYVDSYSIGPQTPDGFGLGYVIHPSYVIVNITSFHDDKISGFRDSITKASRILRDILSEKA